MPDISECRLRSEGRLRSVGPGAGQAQKQGLARSRDACGQVAVTPPCSGKQDSLPEPAAMQILGLLRSRDALGQAVVTPPCSGPTG